MNHYERIEQAIHYINENYTRQPPLNEIAAHVGLSPFHFQRLFQEWAGISPKQFLQSLRLEHAKALLQENRTLQSTSLELGLSGTSRLHDLFVTIEAMTPGEYKARAENIIIEYSFAETQFGKVIIASTSKGVCYLAFCTDEVQAIAELMQRYPNAQFLSRVNPFHEQIQTVFKNKQNLKHIKLHLKGTSFQLKVWHALLTLPSGKLTTYGDIAQSIGTPKAVRAVGTAVGQNPVAYLIPCHRVIRSTGVIGDYRWGKVRKQAMLGWENARQ